LIFISTVTKPELIEVFNLEEYDTYY